MPGEEIIEIIGGLVRTKMVEITSEVPLESLIPHMERIKPLVLISPPRDLVGIYSTHPTPDTQRLELLIELPPKIRTLPLHRVPAERHPTVALPFTLFHFALTGPANPRNGQDWAFEYYRCFHAKESVRDNPNQLVLAAFLPNVYDNASICWGNTAPAGTFPTLGARIDQLVNEWYLSNFTQGEVNRRHPLPWASADWTRWVEETKTNGAAAWRNFPEWNEADRTQQHFRIPEIFAATIDTTTPIRVPGAIPDIPAAITFGRAEEWTRLLEEQQREQLRRALGVSANTPPTNAPPVVIA